MGYKLLGVVVWRGARWYLRRRYPGAGRKLAIAGVSAALLAGVGVAAASRRSSPE